MRSEEILRREAEYRAVREALGMYNVALVLADRCPRALRELRVPAASPVIVGSSSSRTLWNGGLGGGESQVPMDS
jgi:hypothetical protein